MALKNLLDWIVTSTLQLTPRISLPVSDLEDGMVANVDGILYVYDNTRVKWLSVQRQTLVFGRDGNTNNQYLNLAGGGVSSKSGYRLMRNAVIVGISVQTSTSQNYNIHIRKNGSMTDELSLTVSGFGNANVSTNREFQTTDYLQCYLEYIGGGSGVSDPEVWVEMAWRK